MKLSILGLLVAVLVSVLSGCGVVEVNAVRCEVAGDHPHESKGSPGFIVSKGRVMCQGDGKVRNARASIVIQKRNSGKWTTLSSTRRSKTIVKPVIRKRYTIQNHSLVCKNGKYRTGVKVRAKVDGEVVSIGGDKWKFGPAVKIRCR